MWVRAAGADSWMPQRKQELLWSAVSSENAGFNSCGNVGGYVGPYFTGVIKDLTGSFQAAYVSLAGLLLCAGLLMLTLRSRQ